MSYRDRDSRDRRDSHSRDRGSDRGSYGGGFRDRMDPRCKVYVGDLPEYCEKKELEDVFSRYGDLRSVWIARNPPGFAFIEFKDSRDADEAVYKLDGNDVCGRNVKVEIASGRRRGGGGGGDRFGGGGRGGGPRRETCYACHQPGHFARDCKYGRRPGDGEGRGRDGGRRQSNDRRSPRYSRSRSRSPRRNYSRDSRSKTRSPSPKD